MPRKVLDGLRSMAGEKGGTRGAVAAGEAVTLRKSVSKKGER